MSTLARKLRGGVCLNSYSLGIYKQLRLLSEKNQGLADEMGFPKLRVLLAGAVIFTGACSFDEDLWPSLNASDPAGQPTAEAAQPAASAQSADAGLRPCCSIWWMSHCICKTQTETGIKHRVRLGRPRARARPPCPKTECPKCIVQTGFKQKSFEMMARISKSVAD